MLSRLGFMLALAPALACAAELPDSFQLAPQVLHLRINGLSFNSRAFTSNFEPTDACVLLERHWQRSSDGKRSTLCQRAGRWLLISHRAGNVLQTAQLERSGDGSDGFLSEFDPLASPVARNWPATPIAGWCQARERGPVGAGSRLGHAVHDRTSMDTRGITSCACANLPTRLGWNSVAASGASVVDFQRGDLAARAVAVSGARGCILALVEHRPERPGP